MEYSEINLKSFRLRESSKIPENLSTFVFSAFAKPNGIATIINREINDFKLHQFQFYLVQPFV